MFSSIKNLSTVRLGDEQLELQMPELLITDNLGVDKADLMKTNLFLQFSRVEEGEFWAGLMPVIDGLNSMARAAVYRVSKPPMMKIVKVSGVLSIPGHFKKIY